MQKVTVQRSASLLLLLAACSTAAAQITDQERANLPKSFHDDALNITYFYPPHFEAATTPALDTSANPANTTCVQTILVAHSAIPAGPSSFVVSMIDDRCPEELREAAALGPFTRMQILQQLKQYGEPTINHEPTRYLIHGRAAGITLASVSIPPANHQAGRTIYAAKACALGGLSSARHKKSGPKDPIHRILCFDFATQNRDLVDMMFSFIIQFDNDPPEPLFPGSLRPKY